jgi:hypothetical protein
MSNEAMDRERQLIDEIETKLPEFVQACRSDVECVLMYQDSFAPRLA